MSQNVTNGHKIVQHEIFQVVNYQIIKDLQNLLCTLIIRWSMVRVHVGPLNNQGVMTLKSCNPFFIARFLQAKGVDGVTYGHILRMGSVILEEVRSFVNSRMIEFRAD